MLRIAAMTACVGLEQALPTKAEIDLFRFVSENL
jgi:hypothetical protein